MTELAGFLAGGGQGLLLGLVFAGVLTGFIVGALPGFDITTGVALLLPASYLMTQDQALAFLTAMYCAGVFGGSITAILFGIPGTSESVMSATEGHPFTARGKPGMALGIAVVCSGLAGVAATLVLMSLSPALAGLALEFSPGDYAALGVFGCAAVVSSSGKAINKGIVALLLGLFFSTIGADPISGELRFVAVPALRDGVGLIAAIIGLFAVADVLWRVLCDDMPRTGQRRAPRRWVFPRLADYLSVRWTFLRSWLLGIGTGILPGAGASSAAFIAHGAEVRIAGEGEPFGAGSKRGLAAPETAMNAAAVGSLIPLLSLGIPGSATAAVILGAFQIHNLQPGPLLFLQEPALVQSIFVAVLAANVLFVVISLFLMKPLSRMIDMPYPVLAAGILTLAVTGSIATGGLAAAWVMLGFAALGVGMRYFGFPLAPVVLGLVLGPIIEVYFRRGLLMADGHVLRVIESPLAVALLAASAMMLLAAVLRRRRAGGRS